MSFESLLNKSVKKKYLPYQITLRKKKQEQKITIDKRWDNQVSFVEENNNVKPSWFGL